MEENNKYLETENVGVLMRKYAVPCVVSLLVAALYNIVDQFFIANASYLGSYGNAANTVVFPLTVVALAISVMIGDGCCAYMSLCLGRREKKNASKSVGNSIVLCLAASIAVTVLYLIFSESILRAFGGNVNEETMKFSREYFFYITIGMPFYMFGQALNPIIRADGSPKFAMIATVSGAVFNLIFDPVFIFGFRWGMMGAALATILGQLLTAVISLWYILHMKNIKLAASDLRLDREVVGRFIPLGLCSFLSQISLVAAMAAINNMIRKYGAVDAIFGQQGYSQIPMAVVGIVMKFFQIIISIAIGTAAGCIPIVGYNMGAGRKDRAKKLFSLLLVTEASVGLAALLIAEFLPHQLIDIFGAGNESQYYTDFAVKSFRIYLSMVVLACINKGVFIYLQSLGRALASTLLSVVREVIFGVGFALLLPVFFGLDGVLYSMPASDILTFAISTVLVIQTYRMLDRAGQPEEMPSVQQITGKEKESAYRG
jgi:putative MATE family efflux protein